MLLAIAMSGAVAPTSADRKLFEPYRQCVLVAAQYHSANESVEAITEAAESTCQARTPIVFISGPDGRAEMHYTSERARLPAGAEAVLVTELRSELARQFSSRKVARTNAQH